MAQDNYDVIVIGEGVAGLSAAGMLAKSGRKVATFEAQLFGGLIINVNELDPAPGDRHVGGAEYASEFMQVNADLGVESHQEPVTGIRDTGMLKSVATASGTYGARAVVIASGAYVKRLGVPGEIEFEGRGVSQCADCDGPMFGDTEVVVVGGGDSALQESLVLAQYCSKVHLVHRGSTYRGRADLAARVKANEKIVPVWNATVTGVSGGNMVEKIGVKHADGRAEEIAAAGLFAYVGLAPNTDFVPDAIARDAGGFLVTQNALETAMPGVWAIGAVRSGAGGLIADAIADAEVAAGAIRAKLG